MNASPNTLPTIGTRRLATETEIAELKRYYPEVQVDGHQIKLPEATDTAWEALKQALRRLGLVAHC